MIRADDIENMNTFMAQCRVMVMGRKTYESFGDDLPNDMALQVVLTSDLKLLNHKVKNARFTNSKPKTVLDELKQEGYEKILIAGGGELNTSLINQDLIDEIRLIIKPIVLGEGKSIFNKINQTKHFKYIKSVDLGNGSIELVFQKQV